MTPVFVLAVVAPIGGAVAGVLMADRAVAAGRLAALTAAACWFALLVHGSLVSVSSLHSVPLVAAAGCGAALVAAAIDAAALERPPFAGVGLAAVFVALAAGRTTTDGAGLVAAAAVAAAAVVIAGGVSLRVLGPAAAGVAMAGAGVVALRSAVNSSQLPLDAISGSHRGDGVLLLAGAALLIVAGSQRARGAAGVLVPTGAFLAAQVAPIVHGGDGLAAAGIVLALAAATAALAARFGRPLLDRPTAALTLLALAALAGPGSTRGAALLLGAAGTLASALGWPAAALLGLPGGVALAIALSARGGVTSFVEGVLAGVVALALAAAALRQGAVPRPALWAAPALGLGAWLLVAPGTWGWVGPAGLRAYDAGAARALAGSAPCVVVLAHMGRAPGGWYAHAFPPDSPGEDAVRH